MLFALRATALAFLLGALSSCDSSRPQARTAQQPASTPVPHVTPVPEPAPPVSEPKPPAPESMFEDKPISTERGSASWYDVPQNSLAKRRAPDEFTAAHDRLPLGSYVRVTGEENGRSVIVKITDRGMGKKHGIDLCKEAAEILGLIETGVAKVRIDLLRERGQ